MVRDSKVILKRELSMVSADLYMLMEIFMKASGCLTRHMVKGLINTPRMEVVSILARGSKISSMGKAKRSGPMVRCMLATLFRGESRDLATLNGLTETATKENFRIIKSMARVPTFGVTDASTRGSGSTTKWKASASSSGQTDDVIVVVTSLTSSPVKGSSSGLVVSTTREVGSTGFSMD